MGEPAQNRHPESPLSVHLQTGGGFLVDLQVSASVVSWGNITLATAWAGNYHHLIAIRVLLGVMEAGVFPCISVYVYINLPQSFREADKLKVTFL